MAKRLGLSIDLDRCVGCWTCATACKAENNVALGNWWARVLTPEGKHFATPGDQSEPVVTFLPYACMHCENAPCVKVCPTGASYRRPDGIVAVEYETCIGCRTCMAACPYNNRVFNWRDHRQVPEIPGDHVGHQGAQPRPKGVVEKCNFCAGKVDRGQLPMCVQACPADARVFGDLNDPNSEVSRLIRERGGERLKAELGTNPSVYYLPQRRRQRVTQTMAGTGGRTS